MTPSNIATILIAAIVAYIAYRQLSLDKIKFRWNLYDKRFRVFVAVQKILSETMRKGDFPLETNDEGLKEYWESRSVSRFIFGDEIRKYLDEIWTRGVNLHTLEQQLKSERITKEETAAIIDKRRVQFDWFVEEIKNHPERFKDYLEVQEMKPFVLGRVLKRAIAREGLIVIGFIILSAVVVQYWGDFVGQLQLRGFVGSVFVEQFHISRIAAFFYGWGCFLGVRFIIWAIKTLREK